MTDCNPVFRIQLHGNLVSPSTVEAEDLCDWIAAFSRDVKKRAEEKYGISKDEVHIFCERIDAAHSACIYTTSNIPDQMEVICSEIIKDETTQFILHGAKIARKYSASASCHVIRHAADKMLWVINKDNTIGISDSAFITGSTTLYGMVVRTGGCRNPKVEVKPSNNDGIVYCDSSQEIAKSVTLYETYGFDGIATWDSNFKIVGFKISGLNSYRPTTVQEAFAKLSEASSFWRNCSNVNEAISEIRD